MSGDGEERGEGMQERTDPPHPHDVDTLVNALTEDDLRICYHFCLWLSWISLSCHGESQYEEGRTVTGEWISREHLITSVCGERLILLLEPLCVLDENTVFIWLRQSQQGWGSQNSDVWGVPFQKDVNVLSFFYLKPQNLLCCLSSRDVLKMVDLLTLLSFRLYIYFFINSGDLISPLAVCCALVGSRVVFKLVSGHTGVRKRVLGVHRNVWRENVVIII